MRRIALVVLASCGRIGFGAGDGGAIIGDGQRDAIVGDGGAQIVTFGETGTATVSGVTADTFLDQQHTTFNYGSAVVVESETLASPMTGLLRFDLSSLAPTRQVTTVTILLYISAQNTNETVEVYRVAESWTEGTTTMSTGVASWTERMPGTAWTTAGCGAPGSRDSIELSAFVPMPQNTTLGIALNQAGVAVVQGWIADPSTNHGVAFVSPGTLWSFSSKESATASSRPMLLLSLAP